MNPDRVLSTPADLHAGFRRAFALRAVCRTVSWGLLAAVLPLLALRLFTPVVPRSAMAAATLCLIAAAAFIAVRKARRAAPTLDQCRARLDAASHAGGRVLCEGLPGAEAWPAPDAEPIPAPVYAPGVHRLLLPLGVCLVAVSLLLPDSLFRRALPRTQTPGLSPLVAAQEEKIEDLLAQDLIPPEEAASLREWLEQLADNPEALSSPATLEALDHLSADLDRRAAAAAAANASGTAQPMAETPSIAPQIDSLDSDARKLLESLAALDPTDPRCSTGSCDNAKEALEQLLKENAEQLAKEQALCQTCGKSGCEGHGEGEGYGQGEGKGEGEQGEDGLGSGGVAKGPGSAELVYGLPIETRDTGEDHALRSSAPNADPNDTALVDLSASAPNAPDAPAKTAPGALSGSGAPSGTTHSAPSLPRHQSAIREYFEP